MTLLKHHTNLATVFFALFLGVNNASYAAEEIGQQTDLAKDIVGAFDALFQGPHAGARAIHTKGILLSGTFTPSFEAGLVTRAEHFNLATVPILVRFSNFAGLPTVADGDATASPRGMSIKFLLPEGGDTDIVAHSYNGFPAATPEDFLEFLRAVAAPQPAVLNQFLATHPAAKAFAEAPKPPPQSYGAEDYFGVNAFRFTNTAGVSHYGRYRIEPAAGTHYLTPTDDRLRAANYLVEEMTSRLSRTPVTFRLKIQVSGPDDDVTDGSVAWPTDRPTIDAGMLSLTRLVPDGEAAQRTLLFTPLNLVGGIAPSADPLIVSRNRAYRLSYERRTWTLREQVNANGNINAASQTK